MATPKRGKAPARKLVKKAGSPESTPRQSQTAPRAESKRPAHRPRYEPTDQGRAQVVAMVIADIDQDMIARSVGITAKTLRRAYRRELDTSYAIIKSDIASKLVTKARGGDLKAMKFYLETHGWVKSERVVADISGGLSIVINGEDANL